MKFVAGFVLLAVFAAKGFALECYTCDSDFDANCHNMYDRNVRTENCDDSRMAGYQRSVCLKTVTFEYGNRKTSRMCARLGPRRDPCLDKRTAFDISVCEVCDHHLCNGAGYMKATFWAAALPFLAFLMSKNFF